MSNPAYIALSRQTALVRELTGLANNVANATTNGFRGEGAVFSEYMMRAGAGGDGISMSRLGGQYLDMQQGDLVRTEAPLDFAISGEGYFVVETPAGQRLTRAGSFSVSPDGVLQTTNGYRVAGDGGAPIAIPADASNIVVAPDGALSANGRQLGRLWIVSSDPTLMAREGDAMLRPEAPLETMQAPSVRQGYLESSNVEPVRAISRLIEVQRAFEFGQEILSAEDQRIRKSIETIGRGR